MQADEVEKCESKKYFKKIKSRDELSIVLNEVGGFGCTKKSLILKDGHL